MHWKEVYEDELLVMYYEDFIKENTESVNRLFKYFHIDSDGQDILDASKSTNPVFTGSHWQVRQPLYKSSLKRWENYKDYLPDTIWQLHDLPKIT
jgi:hypothetical protein